MCALYKSRYRIESSRLKGYDYSSNAFYFITICTKGFFPYFGEINSDKILILKEPGEIARKFWLEIPNHFPFVKLDEFIIMPNHMHGIINIRNPKNKSAWPVETPESGVSTNHNTGVVPVVETPDSGVSTNHNTGVVPVVETPDSGVSTTLGTIINQYKRICTINIWKTDPGFQWQSRFYDRIVRSDAELSRIKKYIIDNPIKYSKK